MKAEETQNPSFNDLPLIAKRNSDEISNINNKLDLLIKSLNESNKPKKKLSRKEIKELYGISYPSIHKAQNDGRLKFGKFGKKNLYDIEDVEALFKKY